MAVNFIRRNVAFNQDRQKAGQKAPKETEKAEMKKLVTPCLAICALTAVELYALSQGIDGIILGAYLAVVSGIAGYQVKGFNFNSVLDALKKVKAIWQKTK